MFIYIDFENYGCLRKCLRGGSVKCLSDYFFCMGPQDLKTSFLNTRDQSGIGKKNPDEKYFVISEKKSPKLGALPKNGTSPLVT